MHNNVRIAALYCITFSIAKNSLKIFFPEMQMNLKKKSLMGKLMNQNFSIRTCRSFKLEYSDINNEIRAYQGATTTFSSVKLNEKSQR